MVRVITLIYFLCSDVIELISVLFTRYKDKREHVKSLIEVIKSQLYIQIQTWLGD